MKRRARRKKPVQPYSTVGDKYDPRLSLRRFRGIEEALEAYGMQLTYRQRQSVVTLLEVFYYLMVCGIQHVHYKDIHFYNNMWNVARGRKRVRHVFGYDNRYQLRFDETELPRTLDEYQLKKVVFPLDMPTIDQTNAVWSTGQPFVWKGVSIHAVLDVEGIVGISYRQQESLHIVQFYKVWNGKLKKIPRIVIYYLELLGSLLHSYDKGRIHAAALRYARSYWKTTPNPTPLRKKPKVSEWDLLDQQIREIRNNEKQSEETTTETNDTTDEA